MNPAPGERLRRFVGDRIRFEIRDALGRNAPKGWRAFLRTNVGRAEVLRRETIEAHQKGIPLEVASWRDLPMEREGDAWSLGIPLAETGFFQAKGYLLDPRGWQHWPEGDNVGVSVHPDRYRTGNTVYCAFTRLFGASRSLPSSSSKLDNVLKELDQAEFSAIPPSGKLRDLIRQLPHIFDTLGCRILHLLPVNPTPATYARFGRFGSPYAALDLTAVDPALVEFDRRTTGVDQFCELARAVHARAGRLFIDIVINHTGWGSTLQENHPEWFLRKEDGTFASPGAWGTVWEDLIELRQDNAQLWETLAEMFLTWCRRGVDGFRCDAGYMVPVKVWQYIAARVRQEFPETLFLLEGLGGSWATTEALLTEGGMQWAYSELFQNYSGPEVSRYLDYCQRQSERTGLLVHYSETHDNPRLAARGKEWSLLRNRLCALSSNNGGFAFTCGVEWLAQEKILVHGCTGLSWGAAENLCAELAALNRLLCEHPCFFDGAKVVRLSPPDSTVIALLRISEDAKDRVLTLINLDQATSITLAETECPGLSGLTHNLLGDDPPGIVPEKNGNVTFTLPVSGVYCLAAQRNPIGLSGDAYRASRARAAWGLEAFQSLLPSERIPLYSWEQISHWVEESPVRFLTTLSAFADQLKGKKIPDAKDDTLFEQMLRKEHFSPVIEWSSADAHRVTMVPPDYWLLLCHQSPFRASLHFDSGRNPQNLESIACAGKHLAVVHPGLPIGSARLDFESYLEGSATPQFQAAFRFLSREPACISETPGLPPADALVLLANGRGGMARLCVDLGRVTSKYDCALGANLHPQVPVDRHILAKRIRAWINADGFISPLDFRNLASFKPGPPACWNFIAQAGDGRTAQLSLTANMIPGRNTTVFRWSRPSATDAAGKQLPEEADVRLTVRVDLEDRSFHGETKRNPGADHHFSSHCHPLPEGFAGSADVGFSFRPADDRALSVYADGGYFHFQAEWCENIPHPLEATRGQVGSGDAYSPGWFELPLAKGASAVLTLTSESDTDSPTEIRQALSARSEKIGTSPTFDEKIDQAIRHFVVRRNQGKTVIAGYPWFLDWGRDTFIAARGLLAGGFRDEVLQIVKTFARFESKGTLPNIIFGEDASNRDTSDAPLWFGVVCRDLEEAFARDAGSKSDSKTRDAFYAQQINPENRTLLSVLRSIAEGYLSGTPNGIRVDLDSGLVWSPSHFTWMDTNYPAGTPRQGYPVEIQALWIALLRHLAEVDLEASTRWEKLAAQATASVESLFWIEENGYYADCLRADPGQSAAKSLTDDALRSNGLFLISLEISHGERARRCVAAALRYLVVPGALRTLAPLPVKLPLEIYSPGGQLLNDPVNPYWGHYEGDEDTRRKPAYHNGTAWTWTFPVFCEALARAWEFSLPAVQAARSFLLSMEAFLGEGCLGQFPEIVDGDAPHQPRGCDAQAWSAAEALRVWRLLQPATPARHP